MKIVVQGLWHLGCVTAACCAKYHDVVGLDFDADNIARLSRGKAPLLEPGLDELLHRGLGEGKLRFTTDPVAACASADLLWVTYDTPVNDNDESDVESVLSLVRRVLPRMAAGALVLVSAQLPVGTCRMLEAEFPSLKFACSPENLRLGKALDAFEKAARVVVGIRSEETKSTLAALFAPFTRNVLFMRTESAEMVKHALNSFLALSITFINEIARLGEHIGADAREVSAGLKSEPRIGPGAYLGPGGPFAGGTLARDVVSLTQLAELQGEQVSVIPAIKASNDLHRQWAFNRLKQRLGPLETKCVAVLGLVYTPGTDTLRRSSAVELCTALSAAGCRVQAYDPAISKLPPQLARITLTAQPEDALRRANAVVVCTEWPAFLELDWMQLLQNMESRIVVDANRFLEKPLRAVPGVEHLFVGRPEPG